LRRAVIGILAHVDAGKTTLSEAMLFSGGVIRKIGRVDHGNAFLDTFEMERSRGITIFSKQAVLSLPDITFTLLDTPGHADFGAEMERTLNVLDAAILVVSGTDGIQSHTMTVWRLLHARHIPTLVFVNKMDLAGADKERILKELKSAFGDGFFDATADNMEEIACCEEGLLEEYLDTAAISDLSLKRAFASAVIYPCWFGSALKLDGIEAFLAGLAFYASDVPSFGDEFGAKVFKISRDDQGCRLTHMKITGGFLKVRTALAIGETSQKVSQLRIYSGSRFTQTDEAVPGDVIAAVGLEGTYPGQGLGFEHAGSDFSLQAILSYSVILPQGTDHHRALACFKTLEEEEPQLRVEWSEQLQEIRVMLMGQVQLEVLGQLLRDRFGLQVDFGPGRIQYKETIAAPVEGVGHYEPLRHYAEVHLLMEPAERGSGITLDSQCQEDELDRNWQNLILTHLAEKNHQGVLTGSPLTDVTITLAAGKAHIKHTEGGDFRQATYRAVRQGLMKAESILLEPWYQFSLMVPADNTGRALTDLNAMGAESEISQSGQYTVFSGSAPVSALRDYPLSVAEFTHGKGVLSLTLKGWYPVRDAEPILDEINYSPEADLTNTPDSVFCSHGAGIVVSWRDVEKYMHLSAVLKEEPQEVEESTAHRTAPVYAEPEELRRIFERTYGPIKQRCPLPVSNTAPEPVEKKPYRGKPPKSGPEYVLVDGYNIIHAWDELRNMMDSDNLDGARGRLIELMRNYQGYHQNRVIVVFDAYKVKGNPGSVENYGGVSVVYTKEAETADMYIEKVTSDLSKNYRVRVATSDGLEQIIVLSHGCLRISAPMFEAEVRETEKAIGTFLAKL